jgi:hypothetical protein
MDKKEELISEVMTMIGDVVDGHTYTSVEIKLREMYDIGFDEGKEIGIGLVVDSPGDYIRPRENEGRD